jgi:hypothetical protein
MKQEVNTIEYRITEKVPEMEDIERWFAGKGFSKATFKKGKDYVSTFWGTRVIGYKLIERPSFATYYSQGPMGSLFVFEVKIESGKLIYDCYSPLWIFGIWNVKMKFRQNAPWWAKYLTVGNNLQLSFENRFAPKSK